MKSICFIIPYFGKFPSYFDLWLKSAEYNSDIDFLIITDNKEKYEYPPNVTVKIMTFEEFRNSISNNYDFKISLRKPYKICDYRPAYGDLFEEHLKEYEFWGYCDIDLIFGDIRKFITDDILSKYKKINFHGHLSLFKNDSEMRYLYKKRYPELIDYKIAFSTNWSYHFDEYPGIANIIKKINVKAIDIEEYADIDRFNFRFKKVYDHSEKKDDPSVIKQIFYWKNGKLYDLVKDGNKIERQELMYIHLQKRNMTKEINAESEEFFIIPNKFISEEYNTVIDGFDDYIKNKEYDEYKIFKKECLRQKFSLGYWKMKMTVFFKRKDVKG